MGGVESSILLPSWNNLWCLAKVPRVLKGRWHVEQEGIVEMGTSTYRKYGNNPKIRENQPETVENQPETAENKI